MTVKHVAWPLHGFDTLTVFDPDARRRFPIRYLRYWFARLLLENLYTESGLPLSILEVGIGAGTMFGFLGGPRAADGRIGLPHLIERWDALDVKVEPGVFDRYCYSDYIETNVEAVFDLRGRHYDAVVLIHVLEHLIEPEAAMLRLREAVRKNGIMLGGSPTMPTLLAAMHEPWLRWKYRRILENPLAHRHISVLTPDRILRFARRNHLDIDLLTGTFFCRWSGIVLEDSEWWVRANLLWGAIFPALGGEMYFSLRAH